MNATSARSTIGFGKATARIRNSFRSLGIGRCSSSTHGNSSEQKSGGAGIGNVEDKMLPSTFDDKQLFKYCKHPRTASIIGYV